MSLMNVFKEHRKRDTEAEQAAIIKKKICCITHNEISSTHNQRMALASQTRIGNFKNELIGDKNMRTNLMQGTIPLKPESRHEFRSRDKSREQQISTIEWRNKDKYIPERDRATQSQKMTLDAFLHKGPYDEDIVRGTAQMRQRNISKEVGDPMHYGLKHENDRVRGQLGDNQIYDHAPRTMSMVHYPDWRSSSKEKFVNPSKGFDLTTGTKRQGLVHSAWEVNPNKVSAGELYIDGHETMGDISRKRAKDAELSTIEFQGTVKNDVWGTKLHVSQTNRAKVSNNFMKITPYFENFSQNGRLKSAYKPALIETNSVDHIIPFNYSETNRTAHMKDLQSVNKKRFYVNSADLKTVNARPTSSICETGANTAKHSFGGDTEERIKHVVRPTTSQYSPGLREIPESARHLRNFSGRHARSPVKDVNVKATVNQYFREMK